MGDMPDLDAIIQDQIERFTISGLKFEWPVYQHDSPPELMDILRRNGFQTGEPERLLVLPTDEVPDQLRKTASQFKEGKDSYTIRRVTNPDEIGNVVKVLEAVWGMPMPWIQKDFSWLLRFHADIIDIFVAYDQDVPVSTAWVLFLPNNRFASLYGGSTIAAHRNRGLYTRLLALRANEAIKRNKQFLIVNAGEMSKPILSKYGFFVLDELIPCDWGS